MTTPETAEIMEKGKNTMLSLEDLKKGGVDRSVLVICGDGSRYAGEYSGRFGVVFFCIPREKKVVGYVLR